MASVLGHFLKFLFRESKGSHVGAGLRQPTCFPRKGPGHSARSPHAGQGPSSGTHMPDQSLLWDTLAKWPSDCEARQHSQAELRRQCRHPAKQCGDPAPWGGTEGFLAAEAGTPDACCWGR